jgi:predicted ABC-type ATPase
VYVVTPYRTAKALTLVAGADGAGKSSFLGVLKSLHGDLGAIVDDASETAEAKVNALLAKGVSFTRETTLSGQFIKNAVKRAKEGGYAVDLYYIGLNECGECIKRIRNRAEDGGRFVNDADVERRFASRYEDLVKVLPYCDYAVFFDNGNGFAEIGEYRNGDLIITGDYVPEWVRKIKLPEMPEID